MNYHMYQCPWTGCWVSIALEYKYTVQCGPMKGWHVYGERS